PPWLGAQRSRGPCVGITSELLATVGCWGSPLDLCPAHIGLFQEMVMSEWHFINGANRVRLVERNISYREQFLHFGSDVGLYVGTPLGTRLPGTGTVTRNGWSTDGLQWTGTAGTTTSLFLVERRAEFFSKSFFTDPSVSISLWHSISQPGCSCDGFLPCRDPAEGQQELLGYVVATDLVPNGGWTQQLLVLLETLSGTLAQPRPHNAGGVGDALVELGGGLGCARNLCFWEQPTP
uniref:MHC class II beta chain N-terminal domain-containing protein n=1 Tax=Ficedula albicollis TaxID=59894 RepID=A0A803W537_FICAL